MKTVRSMTTPRPGRLAAGVAAVALASTMLTGAAGAAENGKFRIGIVTFLSGPAAGPFGIPSANAAKAIVEGLNKGALPAPYNTKGINGAEIEAVIIDEAGGATKQVEEFRNLVQRQKVDAVVGYISSGDCLAIAPVAEELKALTVFYDCGTSRLFNDDSKPKYAFRTGLDAAVDNIGAARYLAATKPNITKIAGIQQNYAWGQDSWSDFTLALAQTMPKVKVVENQMPKVFQGQYGAEISALSVKKPEVVHSSFWGGDMEAFVLQANARGLLDDATVVLTCGESALDRFKDQAPNGTIIGGRGPFGAFAPQNALNTWFVKAYTDTYSMAPTYPATKMAQAILGLKAAAEKAGASAGTVPVMDAIADAFKGSTFESVSGTVKMDRADGHQALQPISYGTYKYDPKTGKATIENVITFSGECVTPPDGTASDAWIKAGFPGAKCN
ncbi:ABC transporter substrate-binding protein [Xanthobacter agilis]|uniref:Branched-chain amino acid transport system substrate-binding protein n=1 Tax=Xanthobacter agilis TaxID=47492 RepID=A0ABU0LHM0_XANAG|nr:ABC transporter substrate-binding protein [Xanthobacter agilis]MDQ0506637.1 branched-chain amino acid transport system substrate-binding protein [Xanthobacter agilis]